MVENETEEHLKDIQRIIFEGITTAGSFQFSIELKHEIM